MKYVLGVGLTFKKYKKNATIQIFSNNTLIDQYELDKDIYPKEPTFDFSIAKKIIKPFPRGYSSIKHEPLIDDYYSRNKKFPQTIRLYEIDDQALKDEIVFRVKNDDTNYQNGFMAKTSLLSFYFIFLIPKHFLTNKCKILHKIVQKHREKAEKRYIHNPESIVWEWRKWIIQWPLALDYKVKWHDNKWEKDLRWIHEEGLNLFSYPQYTLGGSFDLHYKIQKKHGIKMFSIWNDKDYKGYIDICRKFREFCCIPQVINTFDEDH